jgi:hypothetical protein
MQCLRSLIVTAVLQNYSLIADGCDQSVPVVGFKKELLRGLQ